MRRVILTSSSGFCLVHADRADMVIPLIFRFVSGQLPSSEHLRRYFGGRFLKGDPEVQWSDLVGWSSLTGLAHKNAPFVLTCEEFAIDLIELWFDPEPNSQLQMIWVVDHLRSEPFLAERLKLRSVDFDLRGTNPAELRHRTVQECDVTEREFEIAGMAWEAYRAPTPELCFGLLSRPLGRLSSLKPALQQVLAELPSPITGLGATERRLLELIARGHNRTGDLFQPNLLGMGVFDQWELGSLLEALAFGPSPAVAGLDDRLATLDPDNGRGRNAAFRRSRLSLTEFGKAVLEGRQDFWRHNPIKRWWGGTLLTNERLWRWDAQSRLLIAP